MYLKNKSSFAFLKKYFFYNIYIYIYLYLFILKFFNIFILNFNLNSRPCSISVSIISICEYGVVIWIFVFFFSFFFQHVQTATYQVPLHNILFKHCIFFSCNLLLFNVYTKLHPMTHFLLLILTGSNCINPSSASTLFLFFWCKP